MRRLILAVALIGMAGISSAEELCAIEKAGAYASNPKDGNAKPSPLTIDIGRRYTLIEQKNGWLQLQSGQDRGWARASAFGDCKSAPYPAARSAKQAAKPDSSSHAVTAKPRPSCRTADSGSGCPCGGGKVCVGPRGGRYCIMSGGNKRYGI
ncbi:hypothetical protein SDC9_106845 [bioreactor metagenome]|uniref:SH3b domain-containing protein n=1 Tax=bioreactor metagenome TaxID=1076179 RepID=A0A645B3J8_9ZZZZ